MKLSPKKLGRPKSSITILRELRDEYIKKRDNVFNRYTEGDIRQDSFFYKYELAKENGHVEAISEAISRLK